MAIAYEVPWQGLAAALLEDLASPNATMKQLRAIVDAGRKPEPLTVIEGSGDFSDFAFVDLLDDPIAAGPPMEIQDAARSGRLAFGRRWLDRKGARQPICLHVGSYERSMLGTINPGDVVLIDCHETRRLAPVDDHVYAVNVPYRGATLKRIYRTERGFSLVSDNPDKEEYAAVPIELEEEQVSSERIVGEVIWHGQPPV